VIGSGRRGRQTAPVPCPSSRRVAAAVAGRKRGKRQQHNQKFLGEENRMKRSASALLFLLAASTSGAYAQQAGSPLNETQQLGRQLLAQSCGVCHLPPSLGAKTYGPPLNKAAAAGSDEVMRVFILNGSDRMPAFKYYLKPAEVEAIIAYVRTVPVPAPAPAARGANEPKKGESL
jgi:mono/diheme cytochrome c family protein